MIRTVLLIILSGWGLFCAFYAFAGRFLLSVSMSTVWFCRENETEACLHYISWMQNLGILRGSVMLIPERISPEMEQICIRRFPSIEIYCPEHPSGSGLER